MRLEWNSIVAALGKQVVISGLQRDPSKFVAAPCPLKSTHGVPVYPLEPPRSGHTGRDPRALAILVTVCQDPETLHPDIQNYKGKILVRLQS